MGKHLVFVTDRTPFPSTDGSRRRIAELARAVGKDVGKLTLICPKFSSLFGLQESSTVFEQVISVSGKSFVSGTPDRDNIAPFAAALSKLAEEEKIDAVIAEMFWMSGCFDSLPNGILKILDIHGLNWKRRDYLQSNFGESDIECTYEDEVAAIAKADVVLVVSQQEQGELSYLFPSKQVLYLPYTFPNLDREQTLLAGSATCELLIAAGSRPENLAGLADFLDQAWPVIKAEHPEVTLKVVGPISYFIEHPIEGVERLGLVDRIEDLYRARPIVINPSHIATGIPLRTLDAMAFGCAVVSTNSGMQNLVQSRGYAWHNAESMPEFAEKVLGLLKDASARQKCGHLAMMTVRRQYLRSKHYPQLLKLLYGA